MKYQLNLYRDALTTMYKDIRLVTTVIDEASARSRL